MTTDRKTGSPSDDSPDLPPLSASPSGLSLERLFGEIAKALDGLVQGNVVLQRTSAELKEAFNDLRKSVGQSSMRTETRISDLQLAISEFTSRVDFVIETQKMLSGSTRDATRALNTSREALDKQVKQLTDPTGPVALLAAGRDDSGVQMTTSRRTWIIPGPIQEVLILTTNYIWPKRDLITRRAKQWYATKFVGATSLLTYSINFLADTWRHWAPHHWWNW